MGSLAALSLPSAAFTGASIFNAYIGSYSTSIGASVGMLAIGGSAIVLGGIMGGSIEQLYWNNKKLADKAADKVKGKVIKTKRGYSIKFHKNDIRVKKFLNIRNKPIRSIRITKEGVK